MARNFVRTSSQYLSYTGTPVTAAPFSVAGWSYAVDFASSVAFISIANGGAEDRYFDVIANASAVVARSVNTGLSSGSASTTAGPSTSTWSHFAGVFASNTSRSAYLNGGNKGTNTASVTTPSGLTRTHIGATAIATPAGFMQGYLAEFGLWNAALTDTEVAILAKGVSPLAVRPGSLVAYWPLIGRMSPEIDPVGKYTMTLSGAPTATDHPRVLHPVLPWMVSGMASGSAPNAPSDLTATAVSASQIDLTWTDNASNENGFELQYDTDAGFGTATTVNIAANETSYSLTGLDPSTTYYARIRAYI